MGYITEDLREIRRIVPDDYVVIVEFHATGDVMLTIKKDSPVYIDWIKKIKGEKSVEQKPNGTNKKTRNKKTKNTK